MSANNSTNHIGNLIRDPVLRTLPSGQTVCEFTIAVNRPRRRDQRQQEPDVFPVSVLGTKGQDAHRNLRLGSRVCIQGILRSRKWETADGTDRYAINILATDIEYLSPRATQKNGSAVGELEADGGLLTDDETEF